MGDETKVPRPDGGVTRGRGGKGEGSRVRGTEGKEERGIGGSKTVVEVGCPADQLCVLTSITLTTNKHRFLELPGTENTIIVP